jgi:DNA-binding protein H-NS
MEVVNLEALSNSELAELSKQVAEEVKKRERAEMGEAREKIMAIAKSVGLPVAAIIGAHPTKGIKVAARYRNPENPNETWTGRGRRPNWVHALDAAGRLDAARVEHRA